MTTALPYDPHPYIHEGMMVEVVRGALQVVHGLLLSKEKRHQLVVGVRLNQQVAAVEIDVKDVLPIQLTHSNMGGRFLNSSGEKLEPEASWTDGFDLRDPHNQRENERCDVQHSTEDRS